MMRKIFILIFGITILTLFSYRVTFALFSDNAVSSNNTFTAAAVFPTISTTPSGVPISPSPTSCSNGIAYATSVQNVVQGLKKDGSSITDPNRTDSSKMLGVPDWVIGTGTNFFALGKDGTVTLVFSNPISASGTEDLKIYEATNGRNSYPLEKAKVEVSLTGADGSWTTLPDMTSEPSGDGVNIYDLTSNIKYVRLTETTDITPHDNTWDGVDIDAISGNIVCSENQI